VVPETGPCSFFVHGSVRAINGPLASWDERRPREAVIVSIIVDVLGLDLGDE
jgi:hypothetical protein